MPQHDSLTRTQQMVRAAAFASTALAVCTAPAVWTAAAHAGACASCATDTADAEDGLRSDAAVPVTDQGTAVAAVAGTTTDLPAATDIADLSDTDLEDLVSAIDPADLASVIDPAPLAGVLDSPEQLLSALTDQVSTGDADTSTLQQLLAVVLPGFRMAPRLIARAIVPPNQFDAFDNIITHESGWNMFAINPSSGAYGLPQALPAFKMFSHGLDWPINPITQIRWAYDYMNERYGSPNAAWAFWQAHHWY